MPRSAKAARALEEGGDGGGFFVGEQLAVGQAAVVVEHGVEVVPAHQVAGIPAGLRAIAGNSVARATKARIALDVDMDQIARTGPLIAHRLAPLGAHPRAAVAVEDRPHR